MDELLRELAAIEANSPILCNYTKTLALLRALKAGTVSLDNVTVVGDGWTVAAVEPPKEPAEDLPDESDDSDLPVDLSNPRYNGKSNELVL